MKNSVPQMKRIPLYFGKYLVEFTARILDPGSIPSISWRKRGRPILGNLVDQLRGAKNHIGSSNKYFLKRKMPN